MGHERSHDSDTGAFRHPRGRVVQSLIEAVASLCARRGQDAEVGDGFARIDHRGERCRIGCDDGLLVEASLETETRNPEVGVLVGELEIPRIEPRYRDAPGPAMA